MRLISESGGVTAQGDGGDIAIEMSQALLRERPR